MKKEFESRFMPDVKFSIMGDKRLMLKNIGLPFISNYIRTAADGSIAELCDCKTNYEKWTYVKEVSIYEAIPELVPDGMRYNKELDKLVPDVIKHDCQDLAKQINVLADNPSPEIASLFQEAIEKNKQNLDAIIEVTRELAPKYPFSQEVSFGIVRDNLIFKGIHNLKENSEKEFKDRILKENCFAKSNEEVEKLAPDAAKDNNQIETKTSITEKDMELLDILKKSGKSYLEIINVIKNTNTFKKEPNDNITPEYYGEKCTCGRKIDWYVIGDLYNKGKGSAWDHAGKKLLRAGEGHKDLKTDIDEVIKSLNRWKEQIKDKETNSNVK